MSAAAAAPAGAHGVLLLLRNAVASDSAGLRGAARGAVIDLSLALGRGIHAVLGAPEDGSLALGDLLAGRVAPSRGSAMVEGRAPWRDAGVRKRIAHLAYAPELPDARDVGGALDVARAARGGGEPRAMLERLGAAHLVTRRLATLTHGEGRAVDAAIALSAHAPLVVVVHEPFADVGPASPSAIEAVLREHAEGGAAVVVITSSPRDAARLAQDVLVLERGRLVRGAGAGGDDLLDPPAWPHARPRRMELVAHVAGAGGPEASDDTPARAIARRLASSAAIASVSWDDPPNGGRGPSTLRVAGPDEAACALALLDAADAEGAAIVGLSPVPATLFEVRMATEQLRVAAAWHARMHAMTADSATSWTAPQHAAETTSPAEVPSVEGDAELAIAAPIPGATDAGAEGTSLPRSPGEEPR